MAAENGPELRRCPWGATGGLMMQYHDTEWGFPVSHDQHLFEKICLEGFQSGLSWSTILHKRFDFRRVFLQFEIEKVCRFSEQDVLALLGDASIVRHRGKIQSTINNAQKCLEIIEQFGSLANYFWDYEPQQSASLLAPSDEDIVHVTTSPESVAMSKDLKKRGWSFVGPTTMYAFMQSMGLINDHQLDCHIWSDVDHARAGFVRPTL